MPRGKLLRKSNKAIILNVYNYLLAKPENNHKLLDEIVSETALACKVSEVSIKSIERENRKGETQNPKKPIKPNSVTQCDPFIECAIRRIIYEETGKTKVTYFVL